MAYTEYVDWTTGLTLYGKAKPLDLTWATGIITLAENGTTGEYSASTFVDDTQYSIYVQLAGSPASGDTKIATVTPDSDILDKFVFTTPGQVDATAVGGDATAANQTTILANIAAMTVATGGSVSRAAGVTLKANVGETITLPPVTTYAVDGTVLDCSAIECTVTVETLNGTNIETIIDGLLTKTTTTIQFTTAAATSNASTSQKRWAAVRDDTGVAVAFGPYNVEVTAR